LWFGLWFREDTFTTSIPRTAGINRASAAVASATVATSRTSSRTPIARGVASLRALDVTQRRGWRSS